MCCYPNQEPTLIDLERWCGQRRTAPYRLMKTAMCQLQLTARAYHRVLKLSRTIADLAGSEAITQVHLAEALQYRPKLELM
jgi:magnesium chelatase family protein